MTFIKRLESLEGQIKPASECPAYPEPLTPEEAKAELIHWLTAGIEAIDVGKVTLIQSMHWLPGSVDYDYRMYAMDIRPGAAPQMELGGVADYLQRFVSYAWENMGMPANWPADLGELRAWLVDQLSENQEQGEQ